MEESKKQELEFDDLLNRGRLALAHHHKKQEILIDHQMQSSRSNLLYSKEYGMSTTRGILLLNGGAIISILAFLSNSSGKNYIIDPIVVIISLKIFAVGLVCGILSSAMGYFNFTAWQNIHENQQLKIAGLNIQLTDFDLAESITRIQRTYVIAVLLVIISIILFFVGVTVVGTALTKSA